MIVGFFCSVFGRMRCELFPFGTMVSNVPWNFVFFVEFCLILFYYFYENWIGFEFNYWWICMIVVFCMEIWTTHKKNLCIVRFCVMRKNSHWVYRMSFLIQFEDGFEFVLQIEKGLRGNGFWSGNEYGVFKTLRFIHTFNAAV